MEMTLKPTDLVDFTSLFHQEGFILKKVVGTTYSLNYETLLMLILALSVSSFRILMSVLSIPSAPVAFIIVLFRKK